MCAVPVEPVKLLRHREVRDSVAPGEVLQLGPSHPPPLVSAAAGLLANPSVRGTCHAAEASLVRRPKILDRRELVSASTLQHAVRYGSRRLRHHQFGTYAAARGAPRSPPIGSLDPIDANPNLGPFVTERAGFGTVSTVFQDRPWSVARATSGVGYRPANGFGDHGHMTDVEPAPS